MGVPVIGSRIGGLGELLVDHACGLTFEPGDAKSLQVAARRVRDDAALRERLRASGHQKMADEFSAARSLRILESTYRAVIAERIAA